MYLFINSSGKSVLSLQENLVRLNYSIDINGIFDTKTEIAVKDFQSKNKDQNGDPLEMDGVVGNLTWKSIQNEIQNCNPYNLVYDDKTVRNIKKLHPNLVKEAFGIYNEILARGVKVRFYSSLVSFKEQNLLYAEGRTKSGKIKTFERAGQSFSNYGLALNFCLLSEKEKPVYLNSNIKLDDNTQRHWAEILTVFKMFEWEWGGEFKFLPKPNYVQKTFGLSIPELLKRHQNADYKNGYIII